MGICKVFGEGAAKNVNTYCASGCRDEGVKKVVGGREAVGRNGVCAQSGLSSAITAHGLWHRCHSTSGCGAGFKTPARSCQKRISFKLALERA